MSKEIKTIREIVQLMPIADQLQAIEDYEKFPGQENYSDCFLHKLILEYRPNEANQAGEYYAAKEFAFEIFRFHYYAFSRPAFKIE